MVLATVRASSAIEGPFVPRGHVRLAKACVGYRRSIEYLAWIENAFRVQHPLDIQHQRPLLRVARDWEPCLLLQTDAMFGRDRTDRKRVVKGKSVSVRVDLGGRRIMTKKKK